MKLLLLFQDDDSGQEDFSDSDSDIPDELKHDYIDELTGETHNRYGLGIGRGWSDLIDTVFTTCDYIPI